MDLNETGFRQAEEIAMRLSRESIDAIYSSDLKRAIQTARAISQPHRLDVIADSDFRELDHGKFEGLTFEDIRASHPEFIERWRSAPADLLLPGGERLINVEKRIWRVLERLAQSRRSDETVVVVSHNFPILATLCRIRGISLNSHRSFHIDPCGINHIGYNSMDGWRLIRLNGYASGPDSKDGLL